MNMIAAAIRALLGLFFDDGKLALQMVVLLACTAFVENVEAAGTYVPMAMLVAGILVLLLTNVLGAARRG
jgi:hypothetical protein